MTHTFVTYRRSLLYEIDMHISRPRVPFFIFLSSSLIAINTVPNCILFIIFFKMQPTPFVFLCTNLKKNESDFV